MKTTTPKPRAANWCSKLAEARINFLNWRPDLEDTEHEGLTVAENLIHEPEGYKPCHLGSAGSFSTTGGLAASSATVNSLVAKRIGPWSDQLCAWLSNDTIQIGINGVTLTSTTTGYPLSFATAGSNQEITVFDVSEYGGKVTFVVEASQSEGSPSTTSSIRHSGYLDF